MYSELFERRKGLAIYWHNKASDLRGSAGVLWESMGDPNGSAVAAKLGLGPGFSFSIACWPVYQMLCGMSLELLLKAAIVNGGTTPPATHDLEALAAQARVAVTDHQSGILRYLSASIIWEGRYPVPKTEVRFAEQYELAREVLFEEVPMGGLQFLRPNGALDWQSFAELWQLAHSAYTESVE